MLRSRAAVVICALALSITAAEARPHHNHRHQHHSRHTSDPRPKAWCGYWMRHNVEQDPGPEFNLAIRWKDWGRTVFGPVAGAIGVQRHHVFKVIKVVDEHHVLAISGNDGGRVRTRVRSTKKVVAWRVASN